REGPGPWVSLLIEAVWKGFSMLYSFITILKAKSYPLSFLHTSLDVGALKALFDRFFEKV
ncbi:MAG TPA: hypothetical protein VMV04_22205, partial [Thermodesulfobacteriota bacterium]|nr:hypothetical protein [Thermodesulfobacteriota bacterium]